MDNDERDRWITCEANALWEKLRFFDSRLRLFIAAEIMSQVNRKLKSRESSRYAIDFTQDEIDTKPGIIPDIGDRATRAIDIDALEELRKKTTKE